MTSFYFCKRLFRQLYPDSRGHLQIHQQLFFRHELVFGMSRVHRVRHGRAEADGIRQQAQIGAAPVATGCGFAMPV